MRVLLLQGPLRHALVLLPLLTWLLLMTMMLLPPLLARPMPWKIQRLTGTQWGSMVILVMVASLMRHTSRTHTQT